MRQDRHTKADASSLGAEAYRELCELFGEQRVLTERVHLLTFSYDAFLDEALPSAIVFPHSTGEVAGAVRIARRHGLPVVPRGRGTNLSGGTVPLGNALVIEFSQMDQILGLSADDRVIQVEAGVYNAAVSAAAGPHGYFYAPDPASGKACSIGGNVAEGAGGPHCLKYGVTRNHVRWLRVVLPDGSAVRLGGQAPDLPGYDLVGLFIGSEGTLGICTEAGLELVPTPETVRTMLAVFDSIDAAGDTVSAIIRAGIIPATLEMMDNLVIQAVEDSLAAGFPRDAAAVLLIELDGLREAVAHESEVVERLCAEKGARELRVAHSESERELLWRGRKGAFGAISRLAPNYLVADGTVPRARLPETLASIAAIAEKYDLRVGNVFHAGDGNLHPLILFDSRDREQTERVLRASDEMLAVCVEMGGTISGEHGIGTEKLGAMSLVFTDDELRAQERVKRCLDPEDRCNPGKVLPARRPAEARTPEADGAERARGEMAGEALPRSIDEVREAVLQAARGGLSVHPQGGGTRLSPGVREGDGRLRIGTAGMQRVLTCDPDNLVMHVEAGCPVAVARQAAAAEGLLLPLDAGSPETATIGGAVACNEQGPRRPFFGSVRDVVLGVGAVLADGSYVRFGGQTMKNVAGLDVGRLLIGSLGTLGVVTDVWLRLRPLPEVQDYVAVALPDSVDLAGVAGILGASGVAPQFARLLDPPGAASLGGLGPLPAPAARLLLLGYGGDRDAVGRQTEEARRAFEGLGEVVAGPLEPPLEHQRLVDRLASFRAEARREGRQNSATAHVPRSATASLPRDHRGPGGPAGRSRGGPLLRHRPLRLHRRRFAERVAARGGARRGAAAGRSADDLGAGRRGERRLRELGQGRGPARAHEAAQGRPRSDWTS